MPAFVGLGAPYWDPYARGTVFGITRGTTAGHLARAAVDSMALQTSDLLDAMRRDADVPLTVLNVDGGASVNNSLMQFQSDILDVTVRRPVVAETTALGAAYLAGLAVGYWNDTSDVVNNWSLDREFTPQMDQAQRDIAGSALAARRRSSSRLGGTRFMIRGYEDLFVGTVAVVLGLFLVVCAVMNWEWYYSLRTARWLQTTAGTQRGSMRSRTAGTRA